MTSFRCARILLLISAAAAACAKPAQQVDTQADVAAINAVREREIALVASGNPDSMATVYTSDIVLMPPGEPTVQGQDALKKWAGGMFSQVNVTGKYTSSDVTVSGDQAIDRYTGSLTSTPKDGGAAAVEKFMGVHVVKVQ